MVDIVAFERDEIRGASEVESPVVVAVAGGGPGGGTVDDVVGDCDAVVGAVAKDNVLAANLGRLGVSAESQGMHVNERYAR